MSVFALVERLAPHIESELNLVINSKQEAADLYSKLEKIQEGLQDAEREGDANKSIKRWLKELEDVTYEMDDVLDEWEAMNLQVEVQDTSLNWDKVCSLLDSLCLCFKQVVSRREITLKMKALSGRIDTILTKRGEYVLVSSDNLHGTQEFKQEDFTSLVSNEFKTYGLEDVTNSLVEKLVLEGEGSDKATQIVSIVGVGGVGKSTLAREAYNHPDVDGLFDPKGWVSVSQSFDTFAIAKAILESFGGKSDDAHTLESLVQRIKQAVNKKRFLLVLDNVWTEERNKWESLRNCLDGVKGSRIVVTTRLESVARMMGTSQWQSLGLLSDEDCGRILNGVALEGSTEEESRNLRGIGMEIAKKCNGLPLAARSVGSMLALRSREREWRAVLESPLWKDEDKPSDLFRLLNLSYLDLSPVLKRCLLSSVVFPKGTSISIDEISRVWMAYGYLNSKDSLDEVQLKGFQYLNNLTVRSFFQRVAGDDQYIDRNFVLYKLHDIIYDFASYLSRNDEYNSIMHGGLEKENSSSGKLRTFCVYKVRLRPDIISHLTSVRVLSLRDCNLQGLPEDIGKLIHLRYLNVSKNPIKELPETITGLCNMQTLDLGSCFDLSSLPEGMEKLINLRHLVNTDTFPVVEYPQGFEKLSGLQTLSEIRGRRFGCLRNMNQLRGSLSLIVFLEDFDKGEFGEPNLHEKQHLERLMLHLVLTGEMEEEMDEAVEALKPPPNLHTLWLLGGSGKWLSRWLTSFDNLKVVSYYGDDYPEWPPLCKLPALEELVIGFLGFKQLSVGFLGLENANSRHVAGGFPRLKKLRFHVCSWWEEWEDIEQESDVPVLTSLEELIFEHCQALKDLPHNILGKASSLRVVKIFSCGGLYARYNEESGYDRHIIPSNQRWTVA